ncbi:MAG: alpha/beta hydrolase-fold protein [Opitutaceae bacterium]
MLEELLIGSVALGRNRSVWVDSPDGHEPTRLCLILDAENYLGKIGIGAILNGMEQAGEVGPMTLVFVPCVTPENRHSEYACHPDFARFLCDDLMGWARARFPSLEAGGHGMVGLSLSGLQAIWTALRHPSLFGAVVAQSPSAWYRGECLKGEVKPVVDSGTAFRISVGSEETTFGEVFQPGDLHQTSSQIESCGRLVAALRQAGHEVDFSVFEGNHDSEFWAAEMPEVLRWIWGRIGGGDRSGGG